MIERNIHFIYFQNLVNGKIGFSLDEIAEPGQYGYEVECREVPVMFTRFTNNGKVSKPQRSQFELVNRHAEDLLAYELKLEHDTKRDELDAKELVAQIDDAYLGATLETEWQTVKREVDPICDGEEQRFEWRYQVPKSVAGLAHDVLAIAEKHANNPKFNRFATTFLFRSEPVLKEDWGDDE